MIGFGPSRTWHDFADRNPLQGDIITVAYKRPGKPSLGVRFEEYDEHANHDHYVFWCIGAPGVCFVQTGAP
jgi:hypothetical protein